VSALTRSAGAPASSALSITSASAALRRSSTVRSSGSDACTASANARKECVRRNEVMAFVRSAVGNRAAAIVSGVVFWTILQISQPARAVEAADLSPRYEANVELS